MATFTTADLNGGIISPQKGETKKARKSKGKGMKRINADSDVQERKLPSIMQLSRDTREEGK